MAEKRIGSRDRDSITVFQRSLSTLKNSEALGIVKKLVSWGIKNIKVPEIIKQNSRLDIAIDCSIASTTPFNENYKLELGHTSSDISMRGITELKQRAFKMGKVLTQQGAKIAGWGSVATNTCLCFLFVYTVPW